MTDRESNFTKTKTVHFEGHKDKLQKLHGQLSSKRQAVILAPSEDAYHAANIPSGDTGLVLSHQR